MLNIASANTASVVASRFACAPVTRFKTDDDSTEYNVSALTLLNDTLAPRRRVVHSSDVVKSDQLFGGVAEQTGCSRVREHDGTARVVPRSERPGPLRTACGKRPTRRCRKAGRIRVAAARPWRR